MGKTALKPDLIPVREAADRWIADWQRKARLGGSERTPGVYRDAVNRFLAYLEEVGRAGDVSALTRADFDGFVSWLREGGHKNGTRRARDLSLGSISNAARAVSSFGHWIARPENDAKESGGGYLDPDDDPAVGFKGPKVEEPDIRILTAEEQRALLRVCKEDETFEGVRDFAMFRLWFENGMRLAEMEGLRMSAFDNGDVEVIGKGKRPRLIPAGGSKAKDAMRRYLRQREQYDGVKRADRNGVMWTHPYLGKIDATDAVWFGNRGPLTANGIRQIVRNRARQARIGDMHPHVFRHTFADQWLADGRSEGDLMRIMGWRSRTMLDRYAKRNQVQRALAAAKRDPLGDRI